ncbi:MAG: NAD-dependent epimerase/dehydratase family protein [Aeromicrobium erythreum]
MKILLTGGTGFIGSAVLERLRSAGHDVVAVVRSGDSARQVEKVGATAVVGDVTDRAWFADQLRDVDGAIHTASPAEDAAGFDDAVVDAVIEAFGGTAKPFVHTGGVWTYGSGADLTEDSPEAPPAMTAWRLDREHRLLDSGLVASVVQPGIVHGRPQGVPMVLVDAPRDESGALALVGDGSQHWTTIHVDDLADLYLAVLEQAPGGERYLGVSGENPTVRELGEALADRVAPQSVEQTVARLGEPFAEALLLDQQATGAKAREAFGWQPTRPGLVDELRALR